MTDSCPISACRAISPRSAQAARGKRRCLPICELAASFACTLALLLACVVPAPAEAKGKNEIELSFLNGSHENLQAEPVPVKQGPLVLKVQSPEHLIRVLGNQLRVQIEDDGVAAAEMQAEFEGTGKLIVDVESLGSSSRFTDDLVLPRQTLNVAGRMRLQAVPEGYLITVVEAPASVRVSIHSQAASQIVGLCRGLSGLPLLSFDCDSLQVSLSRVDLPLPEAGEQVLLPADRLNRRERAFFDRLARKLAR